MYLPSCILLLYVCLEAARRNPFSEDSTEAQFGTFAQKWLQGSADRGGSRGMKFMKTDNRANDCQQLQQLTDSESRQWQSTDRSADVRQRYWCRMTLIDELTGGDGGAGAGSNDDMMISVFQYFVLSCLLQKSIW